MCLEEEFKKVDIKSIKTEKQQKAIFRQGVPDKLRREIIL